MDLGLPLARESAGLSDYAQHLQVLQDWQTALTPWLARTGCDLSGLVLMAQDLADCAAEALPLLAPLDPLAMRQADDGSDAFCWGAAYVLEGSRLGGQVLYRRLHRRLAPHPLRYLHQRTENVAAWPETLVVLRHQLSSASACDSACRGAVAAFEVLLARFELAGGMR